MKFVRNLTTLTTMLGFASLMLLGLSACETGRAGIKATPTGAYANVDGTPKQVTRIAQDVLKEMQLNPGDSTSTAAMGEVIAQAKNGSQITVSVERYTDKTSTVTVSIGGLFEQKPQLARKVVNQIQGKANQGGSQGSNQRQKQRPNQGRGRQMNRSQSQGANQDDSQSSMNR